VRGVRIHALVTTKAKANFALGGGYIMESLGACASNRHGEQLSDLAV